jgi:hypothetical protein
MPCAPPKRIAGVAGVALVVLFPFVNFQFADKFVADRLEGSRYILSMGLKLIRVAVLALLAFGVEKRRLSFFGIRRFGWRDLGACPAQCSSQSFGRSPWSSSQCDYWIASI